MTKFQSQALVYPGQGIDPEQRFTPFRGQYLQRDGHSYGMFPQAFAAASAVPFFLFGYAGLYILPLLSALGILGVAALLGAMLLRPATNIMGLIVLGITSPLIFYAINFWEHTPASFFALLAVYCSSLAYAQQKPWLYSVAGFCMGVATALRNEVILLAPAMLIGLVMLERRQSIKAILTLSIGTGLGLLPLLIFNMLTYGNIQGAHVAVAGAGTRLPIIEWVNMLLIPLQPLALPLSSAGLLLIYLLSSKDTLLGKRIFWVAIGLMMLIIVQCTASLEELTLTSLLTSFPWLVLIFLPIPDHKAEQSARIAAYLRNSALLFIGFCLLLRLPDGGAQHGPRMLLPAMPLLLLVGLWRVEYYLAEHRDIRHKAAILIVVTLIAQAALSAQASGLRNYRYVVSRNHTILSTAAQAGYKVIITDTSYTPLLIAPLMYADHSIFMVQNGAELDDLIERLRSQHIHQFYYLGLMPVEVTQQSASWKNLKSLTQRSAFAHRLLGQGFEIP